MLHGLQKRQHRGVAVLSVTPQITVYLEKTLDDDAAARVVGQLQAEQGVEKVNYLSRDEALGEFRSWSGFGGALDMLEENPLPAVAIVVPKIDFQSVECAEHAARPRDATFRALMKCVWMTAGLPASPR